MLVPLWDNLSVTDDTSLHSVHISLFLFCRSFAPPWPGPSQGGVPGLCGTHRGGNCTIVPLYCPLVTLTGMQKGRAGQGMASDTFRNSQYKRRNSCKVLFHFVAFDLEGILDACRLVCSPQILFLTSDCTEHTVTNRVSLNQCFVFVAWMWFGQQANLSDCFGVFGN